MNKAGQHFSTRKRKMWQKSDRYEDMICGWKNEDYFNMNFFYSGLNTGLSKYFSPISPEISFKYTSITPEKHIFNPKPVLKIPNLLRTTHLFRQELTFIRNAAGNAEVALLQVRAKFSVSNQDLLAPQQVDGDSSLFLELLCFLYICDVQPNGHRLPWGTWSPSPPRPAPVQSVKDTLLPRAHKCPLLSPFPAGI